MLPTRLPQVPQGPCEHLLHPCLCGSVLHPRAAQLLRRLLLSTAEPWCSPYSFWHCTPDGCWLMEQTPESHTSFFPSVDESGQGATQLLVPASPERFTFFAIQPSFTSPGWWWDRRWHGLLASVFASLGGAFGVCYFAVSLGSDPDRQNGSQFGLPAFNFKTLQRRVGVVRMLQPPRSPPSWLRAFCVWLPHLGSQLTIFPVWLKAGSSDDFSAPFSSYIISLLSHIVTCCVMAEMHSFWEMAFFFVCAVITKQHFTNLYGFLYTPRFYIHV